MKGQRRHELEQNQLADWLAKIIEKAKPYQNPILGVVLLVVVAAVGYSLWAQQSGRKAQEGWDAFYRALSKGNLNPSDFEAIINDYPETDVAHWARTTAGDLHLAMGCNRRFEDKPAANDELRQAVDHYMKVRQQSRMPMVLQRATFGLARALESQGDLDGAMRRYEEVGKNWPDGAYAAAAARRLEDLKKPATKRMYDRFAKFDPKPSYLDEPGVPGERLPFDFGTLPDDGPLFEPKIMELEEKEAEEDKPQDASETSPEPDVTDPDLTDREATDPEAADTRAPKPADSTETPAEKSE